ncbi:hypothetical protein GGI04_001207 [Coemansia thaxteri]|nr:hypothetical protein GGI04_001207 [Coemansia thaxteri]
MDKIGTAQSTLKKEKKQQARETNPSALIRGMGGIKNSLREVQAELIAQHLLSLGSGSKGTAGAKAPKTPVAVVEPKSRKARNKAAIREEKRFGQILQHPAFQASPLATIRQHLANTLTKHGE